MRSPSGRSLLEANDPEIHAALVGEEARQSAGIELIPSENYTYPEVLVALGSVFTNKYSEGYPGRRYYGGQEYTDVIERLARNRARKLFGAEHANVQPLSGAPMNAAVYLSMLEPGDTVLGMDLSHGGHLTHGAPVSHMGTLYNWIRYKSEPDNQGRIDFDALRETARQHRPKMIVCGYSSYPRDYDYAEFKAIADEVGALTMADVSHIGGLIAGGVMRNPCDAGFDFVTTTTHKSLRGPRGGMILTKKTFRREIDVFRLSPGLQGRSAHEPGGWNRHSPWQGVGAGVRGLRPTRARQRADLGVSADAGRGGSRHRRNGQSHDGARLRAELRHRRPHRRGDAGPHLHHDQ